MTGRRFLRLLGVVTVGILVAVSLLNVLMPSWWARVLYPLDYRSQIRKYSNLNHLDPYTVAAVISVESGFDPRSHSSAGARGLMQLLPDTGRWVAENLREDSYDPDRLYDPDTNIRYGTWYLRHLTKRYDSTVFALAAYNGGGANMDKWLRGKEARPERDVVSKIPFKETREFVGRVDKAKAMYEKLYPSAFK